MLTLAQELSHPFTLVFALYFAAALYQLYRDVQAVQQRVEALLGISAEQGFALYLAWGAVLRGWVLGERGQEDDGIDQIRQGIATRQSTMRLPNALAFLAEAYGKVGQVEEGLSVLAEALDRVNESGERCWEAELHRLKGELLLQQGEGERCMPDAETCFQRAIEVARRQQAKSWELRAATSLGRLWERQGKRDQAREQLQEVYGWFTEGFDTPDLLEAKALLDALA
jgi:predicted ATPase